MKKYILLVIGFFWIAVGHSQQKKNSQEEFSYKKMRITDVKKGTISMKEAPKSNVTTKNNNALAVSRASSGIGETPGELSVSLTGGASYQIPIMVPPGINGVAPEISLTYNSQSGNGLAGYGWNVAGVSVISRIPSTKFHDNIIDPMDFNNLDRFALDGERLVLKSGSYGANGAQFQTENYSNLKIVSYGTSPFSANTGPAYFIVYYPDGSLAHYGNSTDSNSRTNYAITYWQNPQGVRISYQYEARDYNLYISSIKYGGRHTSVVNEIQFNYDWRRRYEKAFINGTIFQRKKILLSIKVFGQGIAYRNYYLEHDKTNLDYQRLISVQEKSGDNSLSHSPIAFNYSNSSSGVSYTDIVTDLSIGNIEQRNAETVSLDFTGNGKMDFAVFPKNTSEKNKFWVFKDIQNGGYNSAIQVNTGSFEKLFPVNWITHNNKILTKQGLAMVQNTTNNRVKFKIYVEGSTSPISYQYEKLWSPPTYSSTYYCDSSPYVSRVPQEYVSGDFNGDGLTDVMAVSKTYSYSTCRTTLCEDDDDDFFDPFEKKSTTEDTSKDIDENARRPFPIGGCCDCSTVNINSSYVSFINLDRRVSSGFAQSVGNLSLALKSTDKLLTADVNGDGKTDILHVTLGKMHVYTLNNNNTLQLLWLTTASDIRPDYPILLGDYNGDGRTDFITPLQNGSGSFTAFLSYGTNFSKYSHGLPFTFDQTNWNGSNGVLSGYNLIPLDANGDGKTDIIEYNTTTYNNSSNGSQTIKVYNNIGASFSTALSFLVQGSVTKTGNLKHFPIPIFLSSDESNNNLDFASISNNWISSFTFNQDHREDVLVRSIENNGVTRSINYNNLSTEEYSDGYTHVYEAGYSETYPNIDIRTTRGTKVVGMLQRSSSGTVPLKKVYAYQGAVVNIQGLGFLGFKGIAKSNWHTGNSDRIFGISKYNPQLRGALTDEYLLPYNINFNSTPSNYISKTSFVKASSLASNKVFKVWNSSSVTQNNLEGTVMNKSFLYDAYNNPTKITTNYSGHGTSIKEFTYANNLGASYYIGRPTKEKQTTTIGGNSFNVENQFVYAGYLLSQKKTKGNGTQFDTETYTYDVYGNLLKKITTPYNTPSRQVRFEYDASGRYILKSHDWEALITSYAYNTANGDLTEETNPFGQKTKYSYDAWNRLKNITDYLNKNEYTTYTENNNSYSVAVSADDGSGQVEVYDPLNRLITVKEKDVLGQWISKSYQFDKFDRISAESEPYFGAAATQWNSTEYDFYGRPKTTTQYTGKTTNLTYTNLSVSVNDGTKTTTTTKNAMGQVTRVVDPGGTINYTYYGNGNLKTSNYDGIIVSTEQDGWGRKTKMTDPSAGVYTFTHNGFGQITKETTPKGNTNYTYSTIGKLTQKKVTGDLTNMTMQYVYHALNKKLSSISLINSDGNNSSYTYTYDGSQRLLTTSEINPYAQFTKQYSYDTFGRIATEESYAKILAGNKSSIKKIKNTYQNGVLKTIRDNSTQEVLWNMAGLNARGQSTSITMGNNLRTKYVYNASGYLTETKSEKNINSSPTQLMRLTFDFNTQRGILNSRTNSLFSWSENFSYDAMDRLVSFNDNTGSKNHSYDALGRITNNSNSGIYNYSGKSYQITSLTLNSNGYNHYDSNMNQDVTYNAFKKPVEIHEANKDKVSFQYNASMGRSHMFYGDTQSDRLLRRYRKHYSLDGSMEIAYDKQTNKTTFVTYIGGDAYDANAIWRSEQGSATTSGYYFLHRDYLGSILMISDKNGAIKEKRHFDAWGNIVRLTDGNNSNLTRFAFLDRGYTGHEHLQGVRLVHMNGRLYDPILHRFMAPDNFIQDPFNTQNYNRYGYVLNNPLMYTDPSGEMGEGGFFRIPILGWIAYGVFQLVKAIVGDNGGGGASTPTPVVYDYDLGPGSGNNTASSSDVPPIPGSGYNLEAPIGIQQETLLDQGNSSSISHSIGPENNTVTNNNPSNRPQQTVNTGKITKQIRDLLLSRTWTSGASQFRESGVPYEFDVSDLKMAIKILKGPSNPIRTALISLLADKRVAPFPITGHNERMWKGDRWAQFEAGQSYFLMALDLINYADMGPSVVPKGRAVQYRFNGLYVNPNVVKVKGYWRTSHLGNRGWVPPHTRARPGRGIPIGD